ncbi:hypothetical protein K1720_06510 [Thermococcus argininiproducens]|uniref:Uncharacterized protein n=1 Tax=Thermococcus argininiproducens TaxID=2866384 RepID=A0A9E7M9I1_9EURY|nr:hypothetical protein [Thermococcus argininiproducens]USG99196.1 hypothetical protein K1720_06510 [Thermococcus argininiproducens]
MEKIEIRVEKERFKELKNADITELIKKNLSKAERTLQAEREIFLLKTKVKLEEKLQEIEAELEELRKFYKKALEDKELMLEIRKKLQTENKELKKELEAKKRESNNKT